MYRCKKCEFTFKIQHMLDNDVEECFLPKCDGKVEKLPPGAINISRTIKEVPNEVGSLTKETIESTREDIKQERETASKRMWEEK